MTKEERMELELEEQRKFDFLPNWRLLLFFLVGWLGFQIIGMILQTIVMVKYQVTSVDELSLSSKVFVNFCAYLLLTFSLLLSAFKQPLFGLIRRFKEGKALRDGIAYGFLLLLVSSALGILINWIRKDADVNANESAIREMAKAYPFFTIIMTVFLAPICEEMTYRLGLFGMIRKRNRYVAYALGACIFALIHFQPFTDDETVSKTAYLINELWNLPSYIVSGLILCRAYEKHGNIATSMIAHAINNGVAVISTIIAN